MTLPAQIFAFIVLAAAVHAQVCTGAAVSKDGRPIEGVRVALHGGQANILAAITDAKGEWRIDAAPGRYQLEFQAAGFETEQLGINVPCQAIRQVLSPAETSRQTVVYRPVADPERTWQADFITGHQLMTLPVERRNYLTLALLTPGVVESGQSVNMFTNLHQAHSPQSDLSIGGNDGRGNIFWLDGGENFINTGGVRTSLSQEAVAEFQVSRNSYSAEFGGGIGGIVNIVSRSGSDRYHGDVYGFLQATPFQALNYFDRGRASSTRVQSGATLGGPLRFAKFNFFAAFERLDRNDSALVNIVTDPSRFGAMTASQQQLTRFLTSSGSPQLAGLGAQLTQALTIQPSTVRVFQQNSGTFPERERNTTASLRLDRTFSDNDQFFLRWNGTRYNSHNTNLQGLVGASSGENAALKDTTLLLNNNYVATPQLVSESRLLFNYFDTYNYSQDRIGPQLLVAGAAILGQDPFLPSRLREVHMQLQQNFFYTPGRHSLRFGVDINPVRSSSFDEFRRGGSFVFASAIPLAALFATTPGALDQLSAALVAAGQPGLLAALNAPMTAVQAFQLGLPVSFDQSFGNPAVALWSNRYSWFVNDVFRVNPRLTVSYGLRYELETNEGLLRTDPANFAPRVGLAWAATRDNKTVVRLGGGIFHMRNNVQIATAASLFEGGKLSLLSAPLTGIPGSVNPFGGGPVTSASIYQGLRQFGVIGNRPITRADLAQLGVAPNGNPYPVLVNFDKNWVRPHADQASFEVERALGSTSLSVAYNFNRAYHLPRVRDLNKRYGTPLPDGQPTFIPIDPSVALHDEWEPRGNSWYHALMIQAVRRYSPRFTLDAHYVLSSSIDDATQIDELPNDSLNLRADRGYSAFHQRHRAVASAVIQPGRGFLLAPVVEANSGKPFNIETGVVQGARPFPLGRNVGRGPAFATFNMRVSRTFRFAREGPQLECILEGFNLLNHTNFLTLNNVVGNIPANALPRDLSGHRGDSVEPLAFTSAGLPRQLQFAIRLKW